MNKIQVILGSTRQGRAGEKVANWVMAELSKIPGAEFELLDLRDYVLPHFDEPVSPMASGGKFTNEVARRWGAKLAEGKGYVIITPEYNHGYPGVLKNALDYAYNEWHGKPVAFVSYGGSAGGSRAVQQLRQVVIEMQMIPIRDSVLIPLIWTAFNEQGELTHAESHTKSLNAVVQKILSYIK